HPEAAPRTYDVEPQALPSSERGLRILFEQQAFRKTQIEEHRLAEFRDAQPLLREGVLNPRRFRVEHRTVYESELLQAGEFHGEDSGAQPWHRVANLLEAGGLVRVGQGEE